MRGRVIPAPCISIHCFAVITQIGDGGAVGPNTACDYNTRIGKGAVLANGSATRVNMEICHNCFAEGVPAVIKRKNLTENDRAEYL